MSVIYLRDFYNNKIPEKKVELVTHACGKFHVSYETLLEMPPENSFGLYSWKNKHMSISANFYKDNILIFSKDFHRSPSIIIHGDGETELGTFFTFNDKTDSLSIFNMNNQFVKSECLGADCFVEIKRVNDKYAIVVTEEICTYDPFTGLVNLNILFGLESSHIQRPYSNSRVHVPLTKDQQNKIRIFPMIANSNGIIIFNKNDVAINYIFSEENLVLYDDVFNEVFDFYEGSNNVNIFQELNFSTEQIQQINNKITTNKHNGVFLKMDQLDDTQKATIFNNIYDAYNELNISKNIERTLAIIKPDVITNKKNILYAIDRNEFDIIDQFECVFTDTMIDEFYTEHIGKSFYNNLKTFMTSGPSYLLILEGHDAIRQWRKLIGPTNVLIAQKTAPYTLRAIYGDIENSSKNACHGSDSIDSANKEIEFFYKYKHNQLLQK